VTITRRGREVARLVPAKHEAGGNLPDLTAFRASLRARERTLSEELLIMRREERT